MKHLKTYLLQHSIKRTICSLVFCMMFLVKGFSQNQLELATASYSAPPIGLTTASQTANLLENTSGATFTPNIPNISVTASISNQQFTTIPATYISTTKGINFGGKTNSLAMAANQVPVYNIMNATDNPSNTSYTSNPNGPSSTGIDVAINSAFYFYNSVYPLFNNSSALNGRFYYGDITLTFSSPVSNPVIQIVGLGANVLFGAGNKQGFTTELELQTGGITLSKLSGNTELDITANKILNNAAIPSFDCGNGAACGSVKVTGSNLTTLVFKIYVRGDGSGTAWSHAAINAGDEFMIGVSLNAAPDLSGNVFSDANGLADNTVNGIGTNAGGSLYANLVDGIGNVVAVTAIAADGSYLFNSIGSGNYTIVLSTTQGVQGNPISAATLPTGWVNTGENVGAGMGSDGTVNGITTVVVGIVDVSNINFGIYQCPNTPVIISSSGSAACLGGGLTLISTAATNYQWYKNGVPIIGANAQTYTPSSSGTYTMTTVAAGGTCSVTSNSLSISINYANLPTVTAQASTSICAGDSVRLSSSSGFSTYQWYQDGVLIGGATNLDYYANAAGQYAVIVSNGAGCYSDTSNKVTVVINAMPTAATIAAVGSTTICSGNGVLLNSSEAVGNQWFLNGAGIFMATNQTHTAVIPGTYTVVIGNGACKSPVSNSVLITGGAIAGFGVNNYNQEECAATPNNFVFTSNAPIANKKYSWDFGDSTTANTINTTHHYTALGNYIVKQIVTDTITGCKDSTTRTVYVSGCGVTSGGGGGVETQPLGDIIAQRLFGNAINSINPETDYNKTPKYISHSGTIINGGNKLKLADIIPQTVANTTNSLVSTPTDLLAFTNAIDILSVDYLSNNSCKAVALGTQTIGNVYGHTKPICDRLKDAQLLEVKKVNIAGFDVIASKLKQRNGLYEFCINFSIGVNQNDTAFRLQSNWLTDHYKQQDTMFNFQLWSVSYNMTASIAEQVINKLKTYKSIKALASNVNDIPKAFIQSVKREKNMLELTIVNPTNYTTGNFEIVEKANELSTAYNKTIPFTITANSTSIIKLNVADVYENNIYMNLSNNNADMVYMTDGGWSVDYDKTTTTLNKFTVTNAPVTIVDNEYPLFRKVKVDATSKSYVSAFKLVKGGGIERDFSKFKTLQFNANGVGTTTLKITLIKQGITNWDNQYTYTLPIDATATNYIISLNKFISKASNLPINLNDITAINFTWENTRGINANIGGTVANVKFATQEAIIAQIINDNEIGIYPNPSNGKFKVAFNSDAAKPLVIKLVDIYTGRTIYNQFVTAKKGMNNYEVILKDFFTSNLYVLSIEGDDVKYIPRKVVIQNSK